MSAPLVRLESQRGRSTPLPPDAAALEAELRRNLRGEVRFDPGSRALYATDGSNYRQVPIGVVLPRDADDVLATVAACRRHGAPVLARGGGTSLAGQCCNVAVVMDFSRHMRRILELDAEGGKARVEPGLVLDVLRLAAERHHLTFGPDPATHNHCTLGGMIGNNSCGVHSVMAGKTVDNVLALDVLTYDGLRLAVGPTGETELARILRAGGRQGEIYAGLERLRDRYADLIRQRYPRIPRRVSGYNLDELLPENGFNVARALVGSEGTCVTILEATVRLVASPPSRTLVVLGFRDIYTAGDAVPEILCHGPIGLEGFDDRLVEAMKKTGLHTAYLELLPAGAGWLLVEFGGASQEEADGKARRLMEELGKRGQAAPAMRLYGNQGEAEKIWEVRKSALAATARVPGAPDTWEGWEDSAVPPAKVGDYLRQMRRLYDRYGYEGALYGHFGEGCIHTRISFDLVTAPGIQKFRSFLDAAADLVLSFGGSLSGEHGDGQARAELLPKMFGPELVGAFQEFKTLWDPQGKMNPHKLVDPYRITENLRLGTGYHPAGIETAFRYPQDGGSLARATLRCVGVGECRRQHGGTMCPSYRVTQEEMHSTRGRARLLFEMLEGDPLSGGWRDEAVKESLELCLSCKGCRSDCPTSVDMATYKAEFLSHYYARRLRPRQAYAFGLIHWWARAASRAPHLVNFVAHAPGLSTLAKAAAGMAPQRRVPSFAGETFTRWFARRRAPSAPAAPAVLLWPDTFTNYFNPEVGQSAVELLEAVGFRVTLPRVPLCCGRPLYDFGMLGLAKRQLRRILTALRPELAAGTPIVGLEPSCLAVFRDELVNLFPDDEQAQRLQRQSFLLSELLAQRVPEEKIPRLRRSALLHGHCHHQAVVGMADEQRVLRAAGVDLQPLDSGCCGMAGSFGFAPGEPYRVSVAAGELVLLPAVRAAAPETLIVADGFSCREQIAQQTERRGLHLSQVLAMGLRHGEHGPTAKAGEPVESLCGGR